MSAASKFMGLVAGVSTVAVIGVAVAQGVEPNPDLPNHPIAAGQQSSHETPMGETGVLAWEAQLPRAVVATTPATVAPAPAPVAAAPQPAAPVAVAQPAPEPAPVAAPATATMGASPEPARQPEMVAQARVARADRN